MTPVQLRMAGAALRLSVADLAALSGVGTATIQRIEVEPGHTAKRETMARLCDALSAKGIRFGASGHQVSFVAPIGSVNVRYGR